MSLSIFLFVSEIGTCVQNLIFTKVVEGFILFFKICKGLCWNSHSHIQRAFFDNKNSSWKTLGLPNGMNEAKYYVIKIWKVGRGKNVLQKPWLPGISCKHEGWFPKSFFYSYAKSFHTTLICYILLILYYVPV